ncbi:hypothetical protein [Sorangium cellulosum]|uniref:hypothetical protein n=1 Tax=Sorangium cellulosum TaxID=56 RepID=UPI001331BC7C|nr:hypothetical protein [Sorangium cellulosum]
MSRAKGPWTAAPAAATACVLGCALLGCTSGRTLYAPRYVARGELTASYDNGFALWAGGQKVAESYHYDGLEQFVRCVPEAREHAREAARSGRSATTYSTLGAVLGIAGLGGFAGLYFYDKDNGAMAAFLGTGIAVAVTGVVLGGLSRPAKESAHGHALDAMNYYNDAVGSLGATCDDLTYPAPAGPEPPAGPELPPPPPPPPAPPEGDAPPEPAAAPPASPEDEPPSPAERPGAPPP